MKLAIRGHDLGKKGQFDLPTTLASFDLDGLQLVPYKAYGDIEYSPAITDEQAKKVMKHRTGCENVADFQRLTPVNREKAIQKLRKEHLSLRQISRLTGISLMVVRRIVEK